jgi:hypothetical protein
MTPAKRIIMMGGSKRLNLMTANQSNVETNVSGFASGTTVFERSNEKALYGNYSLKVTPEGQGSTEEIFIYVPVSVGLQYSAKVNIWIPTGHSVIVAFDWTLNGTWKAGISESPKNGNDAWQSATVTGVCPATANMFRIALRRVANTDTTPFYYDGGIVEQSDSIGDYSEYYFES